MTLTTEDNAQLAHALRRLGFGASPQEWADYSARGLPASMQRLLNPDSLPDNLAPLVAAIGEDFVDYDDLDSVRQLWMYRMVHTQRPLEEKMAFFWHNHFACANYKVNSPRLMWRQNEIFRSQGLGSFRTLLQTVATDPAMLIWLDGAQNRNGAPNENFARECMELFTMGAFNGYTEQDVKEGARCFTGWQLDRGTPRFAPYLHDDGSKTFLGREGNYYLDDAIDIICANPNSIHYICQNLFEYFAYDDPSDAELKPIETVYRRSGYNIRDTVESIVMSPAFSSEKARYARIKSPVELVVGHIRLLGASLTATRDLYRDLSNMGQELFNPPNVKGWPSGTEWINARTLLARFGFARGLTEEMAGRDNMAEHFGSLIGTDIATPESAAQSVWNALMPGRAIPAEVQASLVGRLREGVPANAKDPVAAMRFDQKLPSLLGIVVNAPEYQLA